MAPATIGAVQSAFAILVMFTGTFIARNMHIKSPLFFDILRDNWQNIKTGGIILKSLVIVCLAVLCVFGMVGLQEWKAEKNRQEITVMSPIKKSFVETVTLYGTIKEDGRESVFTNGTAMIDEVFVMAGDLVSKGDPLMSVRPIDDATLSQMEFKDAETWAEQLYRDSVTDLDHVYQEIQAVFNRVLVAEQSKTDRKNNKAYTLYSPIDGMVVSVSGKSGDGVTEYFPSVIVTDLNKLFVKLDVSETALKEIKLGDACSITVSALGSQTYAGEVTFISPYAHETDLLTGGGTYVTEVMVSIDHSGSILKPGYQAAVKVNVGEEKNAIMIPYDAVAQDEDGIEYVMVWTGKQAYRQNIVTGKEIDEFVQVLAGITEKHKIIRNVNQISFTESTVLYETA